MISRWLPKKLIKEIFFQNTLYVLCVEDFRVFGNVGLKKYIEAGNRTQKNQLLGNEVLELSLVDS